MDGIKTLHTKGIILVYSDGTKEHFKSIDECPISNEQLLDMLSDNHYSKTYDSRAFYNGDVPKEFEYLFEDEQPLF